jgi:hypothetical protein
MKGLLKTMLENQHLEKLHAVTVEANQHLNQLEPISQLSMDRTETWQEFCQSMHALLDLALDPQVSADERAYAWSHLQQWRAWGIRRV